MSLEVKIHDAQTSILRELLFVQSAGYAQLQKPTKLTSDHFNFHISKLVALELVEKVARGQYRLTPKGKEYANKLDTDDHTIERQPKSAVILAIEQEQNGKRTFLFQERLKNPYFGFWGLPSGKIRWGETITDTAIRESEEETGLLCNWRVAGVYHEHVALQETGEFMEDKIFFVVHGTNPSGTLKQTFEGGANHWLTPTEANAKAKKFDSVMIEVEMVDAASNWLVERKTTYSKAHF